MIEKRFIITENQVKRYLMIMAEDAPMDDDQFEILSMEIRSHPYVDVLDIISRSKSALYESGDGVLSQTLKAKMDVLCCIEEELRKAGEQG